MSRIGYMLVVPIGAVLFACACLTGCGRDDSAVPAAPSAEPKKDVSRVNDAAYQEQLKGFGKDKQRIGVQRAKIESRMARMRERARKALPEGATDAQILAELENNPKKYPAWLELVNALKDNSADEERNRVTAQTVVRRRIQREVAERAQSAAQETK